MKTYGYRQLRYFYDWKIKLWTIYGVDNRGNQCTPTFYHHSKKQLLEEYPYLDFKTENKMKTNLNREIKTLDDAKQFLKDLYNNNESFHPEESAHECIDHLATPAECDKVDDLIDFIYNTFPNFDPCGYYLQLSAEEKNKGKHW